MKTLMIVDAATSHDDGFIKADSLLAVVPKKNNGVRIDCFAPYPLYQSSLIRLPYIDA
ncbi:hypothetical protein OQJ13_14130 [Legionella sp. PATHC035]|uniref:hypothetical protein n=1 Tax=Legionella sp. PATHC035 TaxID=2992040 RepID=UPI00224389D8|nr:hypothetical protein [Legionella sp. PATHC035]MCW8410114.1 hypothetical protein [Legionella sp. PATHC035]